ncbi:cytochrome P450 4C1-like isoform X2 [Leptidea sinapis]|uniref:cytochrome P450 4C1-like isoform X2 n=1 Tax=Leptidea sinapis TaxID=189913 RepID=UPI0021C2D5B3|nr:cytochrome P450 4C1-like isoform X2 [Leptidea sinapis]
MIFTLIVIVFCLLIYNYSFNNKKSRKAELMSKIPGPKGSLFIGTAVTFLLSPELFLKSRELYKDYKGITKFYGFNFGIVNIYDPDDIETILSNSRFIEKRSPYTFLGSWLGEGLLVSNGAKWQERRKMLTPAFHFNILKKYFRSFLDHTQQFFEIVSDEVGNEKTDLSALIRNYTLKIMCETTMAEHVDVTMMNTGIDKYFNAVYSLGQCVVERLCRIWYYNNFIYKLSSVARRESKALATLHEFTENVIRNRRKYLENKNIIEMTEDDEVYGKKGRLAMLDLLLQNEREGKIDFKGIREEVDTFMFEGHDTTATSLMFTVMRIANEPEIQENIYKELKEIFQESNRMPTLEDLNEMKYLHCCIMESLRIYPPVPFIARRLKDEVVLSGYTLPSGIDCYIFIYDLHHREDLYPEPEKFIPERFLPENHQKRHRYAYVPFSAGQRNCIGQKFAMLEMKTFLSGLLRKFKVEPVTKHDEITFSSDVVLRATQPLFVKFRPRSQNCN